jgi:hypothetical protein
MKLLHQLGDEEARGPGGTLWRFFIAGALQELSVGLFMGNFLLSCASAGLLTRVSGTHFQARLDVPTDAPIE